MSEIGNTDPYLQLSAIQARVNEIETELRHDGYREIAETLAGAVQHPFLGSVLARLVNGLEDEHDREQVQQLVDEHRQLVGVLTTVTSQPAHRGIDDVTLIHTDHFAGYATDLAEDLHGIQPGMWPLSVTDWNTAANRLRGDYQEVDYDGATYLYRA